MTRGLAIPNAPLGPRGKSFFAGRGRDKFDLQRREINFWVEATRSG